MAYHKLFKTRLDLYKHFENIYKGVDKNTTLKLPIMWIAMEDGTVHKHNTVQDFAKFCNENFNTNINSKLCRRVLKSIVLYFDDEVVDTKSVEEVVDIATPLISLEVVEDKQEVVTEEVVLEDKGVSGDSTETPFIDWDRINSLSNTKEDKVWLDNYATGFNIELKRNKSLDNMIIDFKAALGIKSE